MSDGRKRHRKGRPWIWIWSCIGIFFVLSYPLGIFIDCCIIFPPSRDVQGHGVPIFMILLPMLAIGVAAVTAVIGLVWIIVRAFSSRAGRLGYEYLKLTVAGDDAHTPALLFHEIDVASGRCSTRCIQVYRNGYVECLSNHGVYAPVPTAADINAGFARSGQRADIVTEREFEELWNSRRYRSVLL